MRVLFFHQGRINDWAGAVLNGLKGQFPEAEVLVFDLHHLIKERPAILARNAVAAGMRYGWDLARGKRDLDDAFFTTDYIFHKVREISAEIHARFPSDFSFQMHSMHDHSSPERPHFVYTDFTYQRCRENLFYGKYKWVPSRSDRLMTLEREIYLNCECTFSQTDAVVRSLVEHYGVSPDKALNTRYGPNIDHKILAAISDDQSRYSLKTVLFIGGDWSRKGGIELLSAFKRVREWIPEAKLVILGCDLRIQGEGVKVVGKVPLCDLPGYYAKASVFCMPSKLEPSAGVYVEAMHAGLPVVALDAKETREVVTDGASGFLVQSGDVDELADRLASLLLSPETCAMMGRAGRQIASERYVWQKTFGEIGHRIRESLAEM